MKTLTNYHELVIHPVDKNYRIVETTGKLSGKKSFTIQRRYGFIFKTWVTISNYNEAVTLEDLESAKDKCIDIMEYFDK